MRKIIFAAISILLFSNFIFSEETEIPQLEAGENPVVMEGEKTLYAANGAEAVASKFTDEDFMLEEDPEYYVEEVSNSNKNRIDNPHRIFEMGFALDVSASNNIFGLNEIFVKTFILDLKKIADKTPSYGFAFKPVVSLSSFMNLNLFNGLHLGFESGLEVNGSFGIGKSMFDFLGYGNSLGALIAVDANAYADVFTHVDIKVGLNFLDGYHLEVQPAIFLPLAHVNTESAKASLQNTADGKIAMTAEGQFGLYSFTDLQKIIEQKNMEDIASSLNSGWGFDIASSVDKEVIDKLVVQAYSRIPIVPGKLNHKATLKASVSGKFDGVQRLIESAGGEAPVGFTSESTFSYSQETYNLSRPFRIGGRASYQPFGDWVTFGAQLGLGVKEPYSGTAKAYAEYEVSARVGIVSPKIGEIIGFRFSHGYLSEIFHNQITFLFNFRAFELNLGVSFKGSDFPSSFALHGLGAFIYMAFGW